MPLKAYTSLATAGPSNMLQAILDTPPNYSNGRTKTMMNVLSVEPEKPQNTSFAVKTPDLMMSGNSLYKNWKLG